MENQKNIIEQKPKFELAIESKYRYMHKDLSKLQNHKQRTHNECEHFVNVQNGKLLYISTKK